MRTTYTLSFSVGDERSIQAIEALLDQFLNSLPEGCSISLRCDQERTPSNKHATVASARHGQPRISQIRALDQQIQERKAVINEQV